MYTRKPIKNILLINKKKLLPIQLDASFTFYIKQTSFSLVRRFAKLICPYSCNIYTLQLNNTYSSTRY